MHFFFVAGPLNWRQFHRCNGTCMKYWQQICIRLKFITYTVYVQQNCRCEVVDLINFMYSRCCGSILSSVQIYFLLFLGIVMHDNEFGTEGNKIWTKNEIEPQHRLTYYLILLETMACHKVHFLTSLILWAQV